MEELIKYFRLNRDVEFIGDIKWDHAVNSIKQLDQAISNPEIDFLEIDISLSQTGNPIAAHYPERESDLSFAHLLEKTKKSSKGLKLDFKDQSTVVPCLKELASSKLEQPIVLNADILSVKKAPEADISPEWFISVCQKYYSNGLLSLGWRTNSDEESVYSPEDIDKMLVLCTDLNDITFPVRASLLPSSWENIKRLLEKDNYTLTIWNSEPLSIELREWIIQNTDKRKCFYDSK